MKIDILTIFPEMFQSVLSSSIIGRARENGLIDVQCTDIRPFSECKHKNTDDYPFGGGAGMVMLAQPIADAMASVTGENFHGRRIYLGPRGRTLTTRVARELSHEELAAMVLVDCVSRFIPGVLGSEESPEEESFSDGLLEYPQYTRPREWNGMEVPEVLLSGNHAKIREWRRQQSLLATQRFRPDLFEKAELTVKEKKWIREVGLCSSEN